MIRRFNRYELKFLIHVFQKKAMIEDLSPFVRPDVHGDRQGGYPVVSLYYDSPNLSFYQSKIDGIRFRRKVRLRIYPFNGLAQVENGMVEIKQRLNRTVQKKRVSLPLKDAERLCAGRGNPAAFTGLDQETVSEVRYIHDAMQLRPTCIISYRRQAFVGCKYEPGLRITFDTALQSRTQALKVNGAGHNRYFIAPSWCVLEVKINDFIPTWVNALLAKHGCVLQRVSKYCSGLAKSREISTRDRRRSTWTNS